MGKLDDFYLAVSAASFDKYSKEIELFRANSGNAAADERSIELARLEYLVYTNSTSPDAVLTKEGEAYKKLLEAQSQAMLEFLHFGGTQMRKRLYLIAYTLFQRNMEDAFVLAQAMNSIVLLFNLMDDESLPPRVQLFHEIAVLKAQEAAAKVDDDSAKVTDLAKILPPKHPFMASEIISRAYWGRPGAAPWKFNTAENIPAFEIRHDLVRYARQIFSEEVKTYNAGWHGRAHELINKIDSTRGNAETVLELVDLATILIIHANKTGSDLFDQTKMGPYIALKMVTQDLLNCLPKNSDYVSIIPNDVPENIASEAVWYLWSIQNVMVFWSYAIMRSKKIHEDVVPRETLVARYHDGSKKWTWGTALEIAEALGPQMLRILAETHHGNLCSFNKSEYDAVATEQFARFLYRAASVYDINSKDWPYEMDNVRIHDFQAVYLTYQCLQRKAVIKKFMELAKGFLPEQPKQEATTDLVACTQLVSKQVKRLLLERALKKKTHLKREARILHQGIVAIATIYTQWDLKPDLNVIDKLPEKLRIWNLDEVPSKWSISDDSEPYERFLSCPDQVTAFQVLIGIMSNDAFRLQQLSDDIATMHIAAKEAPEETPVTEAEGSQAEESSSF